MTIWIYATSTIARFISDKYLTQIACFHYKGMCFVSLTFEISFLRLHRSNPRLNSRPKTERIPRKISRKWKRCFTVIKFACYFPKWSGSYLWLSLITIMVRGNFKSTWKVLGHISNSHVYLFVWFLVFLITPSSARNC